MTIEGLGTAENLHPLQEAFVEEQAIQCGYCAPGMIVAAQGLLNRVRGPTDEQFREALSGNICRCGVYDRGRQAIRRRIGHPDNQSLYEVVEMPPLANPRLDQPAKLTPPLPCCANLTSTAGFK
jgi:xanthine dehydrogenase iron-sulfur cluster and FAD-binding subunit A